MNAEEFQKLRRKSAQRPTWTGWRYAALIGGLVGELIIVKHHWVLLNLLNNLFSSKFFRSNNVNTISNSH